MTNVETLQKAGLIQTTHPLTPEEIASVDQLSTAEVDALISVHAKLGDDFFNQKPKTDGPPTAGTFLL